MAEQTIINEFLKSAEKYSDQTAVEDKNGSYTYKELELLTRTIAQAVLNVSLMQGRDIRKDIENEKNGQRVCILFPRNKDFIAAALGVLRAGCAYIPMDTGYPEERLRAMIADSGSRIMITTRELSEKFPFPELTLILMDDLPALPENPEEINLSRPGNEGFITYTSGSTGKPKGVVNHQCFFTSWLEGVRSLFPTRERINTATMVGLTFVAGLNDLFPGIATGGKTYIFDEQERLDLKKIREVLAADRRHLMFVPPKMARALLKEDPNLPIDLLLVGGEKFTDVPQSSVRLVELYGATELGFGICHQVTEESDETVLGRPARGCSVFLVDENGEQITEPGVIGEACFVSPYIARGYSNLPEETAGKFTDCPFLPGQRMYHSGDMMAWTSDGQLRSHGRKDNMVKLDGFRIELGEVESVCRLIPGVHEAACVIKPVLGTDKLFCYYTLESDVAPDPELMKKTVGAYVPKYMIPGVFEQLEALPVNANGKLDRLALKAIPYTPEQKEYAAPETPEEEMLCAEFSRVLNLENIGIDDDFFELGGNSLAAASLIPAVRAQGYDLSYQDLYQNATPRTLGKKLADSNQNADWLNDPRESYPLTKTQMGIYLEGSMSASKSTYTIPYLLRAEKGITAEEIREAIDKVLQAHPGIKFAVLPDEENIPRMFMRPDAVLDIPVTDGDEDGLESFMKEFVHPMSFGDHLLLEFAIYRTPERCYVGMLGHLILIDGTTISLLIEELNRALSGKTPSGEERSIQQAALMEEQAMQDGSYERAKQYYEDLLGGLPAIEHLPGDLDGKLESGVSRNYRYDPHTLDAKRVQDFCRHLKITEATFFLGAMAITIGKYLRSQQVAFSTVYNGRAASGLDRTTGTLIKRIPVYGNLEGDLTVSDFLQGLGKQIFSTMANDIFSFDEVLKYFQVSEDVEFIYQGDSFTDQLGGTTETRHIEGDYSYMHNYHTGMVTGLMSIQLFLNEGWFNMTVEYRNQRFTESWIENFSNNFFRVAESLMNSATIASVQMLTPAMEKRIADFNRTEVDIEFTPIAHQIHCHALAAPEKTAVIANGCALTYRELNLIADRIADKLIELGVQSNDLVAVMLDRTGFAYAAELAVLKAGGAFLPFVPEYPDDRIDYCMQDSGSRILITREQLRDAHEVMCHREEIYRILTIEEIFGTADLSKLNIESFAGKSVLVERSPEDLAYCIYTSGSTGRPKGVLIEQKNIANYVHRNEKSIELIHYAEPGRVSLALAALSFDVSVVEAFIPLCNGNTVCLATDEEIHDPDKLAALILNNAVTGITCTPSMIAGLLDLPEFQPALRQLDFYDIGAEAFPPVLYERLRAVRKDSVILNVYGPTECTMGCAAAVINSSESIVVGKPIANTRFYVADRYGNSLPIGVRGELIICGDQVGRGYINLPEKTAAAFFEHDGLPAYHSGDLSEWTSDGDIRIIGRLDNQIKLRGFRIELDEIENVMSGYPGIKICAVKVCNTDGEFLAGYYAADRTIDPDELEAYLREKLTEYMVPSVLMQLDSIPLTVNGKADRRALPDPDISKRKTEFIAPRNEQERKLCNAFEQVLGLDAGTVGILDDFSSLGGNSLNAMRLSSLLKSEGLSVVDIFAGKTPEKIAAILKEKGSAISEVELAEQEREARGRKHLLTEQQTVMVDYQLCNIHSRMFNLGGLLRFGPSVDALRLCNAVNLVLNHHPVFSSVLKIDLRDGSIYQQIDPSVRHEVSLEWITERDMADLAETLPSAFSLFGGPLLNVRMFRTPNYTYLFLDMHHVIADGTSIAVMLKEIAAAYAGAELPEDHYYLYLTRREARKNSVQTAGDLQEQASKPVVQIPEPDFPIDGKLTPGHITKLTWVDLRSMEAAEKRLGESRNVIAITAALMALGEISGENSVGVDWLYHNRTEKLYEATVGNMITDLSVGLNLSQYENIRELVHEVARQVGEGISQAGTADEDAEISPFMKDSLEVNYLYGLSEEDDDFSGLDVTQIELPNTYNAANNMMAIYLSETHKGIRIRLEYIASRYSLETARHFLETYCRKLVEIVFE